MLCPVMFAGVLVHEHPYAPGLCTEFRNAFISSTALSSCVTRAWFAGAESASGNLRKSFQLDTLVQSIDRLG